MYKYVKNPMYVIKIQGIKHITKISLCSHSMDIDMDRVDPEQPNQKKNTWIDPFENVRTQRMQMMIV